MTFEEFQSGARRTVNPALNKSDRLMDAAAGLAEEAGELLGLVRKRAFQGREVADARLTEELGDVLWCLAMTADSLGISLDDVAKHNADKLRRRFPAGFDATRTADDWSRSPRE
jgi:NTP pyrophosphatase (non-canonical NTP hydrolase)